MSDVVASCPGCGDRLTFRNPATVTVVCPSCGSLCARSDLDLERLGKVAELAPIDSPLSLGEHGRFGSEGWTAVGLLQLDHGAGPWNEWCLLLDSGGWAWLAEAQGELLWTRPVEGLIAPPYEQLEAGDRLDLGVKAGTWTIAEVGSAHVVSARGELPTRITPGSPVRYADLRGPGGGFATLDYGDSGTLERVYVGRKVEGEDVGLDPTKVAEQAERRASAGRLSCPNCGGEVRRFDPEGCPRVTCGSCGSLLDASSRTAKVIGVGAALAARAILPLGNEGTFEERKVRLLAFLVRSVKVDGVRYPWREYLLRTDRGAYRWLVESRGHWSVGDAVSLDEVRGGGEVTVERGGETFRHFTSGNARVDHVQGEVYWQVEVGETVRSEDYVSPPSMLTIEGTKKERTATLSHYVEPEVVAAAFAVPPERLPARVGVGAMQPNPHATGTGAWWLTFAVFAVAIFGLMGVLASRGSSGTGETTVGLLVLGLLALPPIFASTRKARFEMERWSESDHPMGGSWGGGEDEEEDEGEEDEDEEEEDEEEDEE